MKRGALMARWTFEPGPTAAEFCARHMMVTYVRGAFNRHDFGVSWNDTMDKGGVVVGDTVSITIDGEAVWESD
jgi:polyisoprenoid-binding protein YceI